MEKYYKTSLMDRVRKMISATMSGHRKETPKFAHYVGCSLDDFRWHIERQFRDRMTWRNYGSWTLDHIEPCAMYDSDEESEMLECHHWTNLRPVLAEENDMRPHYHNDEPRAGYDEFKSVHPKQTTVNSRGLVSFAAGQAGQAIVAKP